MDEKSNLTDSQIITIDSATSSISDEYEIISNPSDDYMPYSEEAMQNDWYEAYLRENQIYYEQGYTNSLADDFQKVMSQYGVMTATIGKTLTIQRMDGYPIPRMKAIYGPSQEITYN